MRECLGCRQILAFDKFDRRSGRDPETESGYQARCVPCRQKYQRERRQANLEKVRAYDRQRYQSDPSRRATRVRNPMVRLKYRLQRDYGMTLADYTELVGRTNGLCAICGETPKRSVVDHDHKTGRVRGILCANCNSGIGLLGDNPATIRAAIDYLQKYEAVA